MLDVVKFIFMVYFTKRFHPFLIFCQNAANSVSYKYPCDQLPLNFALSNIIVHFHFTCLNGCSDPFSLSDLSDELLVVEEIC